MRAGEFSDGAPRAAREDRHGIAQHEHARSDALPDPPCHASPHRRRVVHLPDLRLRPPHFRCARGGDAFAVHAGVRRSPAVIRLGDREYASASPAAADRVRAAQPELHGDEQAQAAGARRTAACQRLGRSADADDRRHQAPGIHAGGRPRLLRAHRRGQEGKRHRHRAPRAHGARGSQPPGGARARRRPAAQGRYRELPGGTRGARRRR